MRCLIVIISFITLCSCSIIAKPQYINPESDLRDSYLNGLKDYQKKPKATKVPDILKSGETYIRRMDFKIQKNNKLSLQ